MMEVLADIKNCPSRNAKRIHARLVELIAPDAEGVSAASLRGLYRFLRMRDRAKHPDVSISNNGNIVIEWRDKNYAVTVEFLDADSAKIVMFSKSVPIGDMFTLGYAMSCVCEA